MVSSERSRWNARYEMQTPASDPAAFVVDRAARLPPGGRAMDVAGGSGRHAVWLARRGFEVTLLDVSDVALERAAEAAATAAVDLVILRMEVSPTSIPVGPFDVVVVHHFLDREVWAALPSRLAPGGILLACQPTVRNLERNPRPSARWLLDEGEVGTLARTFAERDADLRIVEAAEGWTGEDRHEAGLVVRRAA